ncbi:GntR family transcriptional regulator [Streptomyces longwoodensis]|uniref:FadR family transcriptional regulator n=1 Tax=Streptomyces lasalocidi TaxID=324833 RepID=A0A4U5WAW0_STRLS|nr:GntR family transcriptional regulator [Streptomyces lasalocidi]TKS98824.1 FadR family transcriptional regulator [Streptomyces lasalocidi]
MSAEAIVRQSVVDVLEERLRTSILDGALQPGSLLPPERELAASYGVTRTTLKHALSRLEQAGLLRTRHGVGTRVLDFLKSGGADLLPLLVGQDGGWLADVFEARRAIGALIARKAAAECGAAQAVRLRAAVDAVAGAPDAAGAQLAELEVHRELARTTGNRVYVLLTNTLLNAYLPVRHLMTTSFADPATVADRVLRVVEPVADGKADEAGRAAEDYFRLTAEEMTADLARHGRRR